MRPAAVLPRDLDSLERALLVRLADAARRTEAVLVLRVLPRPVIAHLSQEMPWSAQCPVYPALERPMPLVHVEPPLVVRIRDAVTKLEHHNQSASQREHR